jgi:formate dehydrogenase beta subunit
MPGSEHVLGADLAVEAIGQIADETLQNALPGVSFTRSGMVAVAPNSFATSREAVFAAGDIVNGGTTVVQAVAEGVKAARQIDTYLRA